MYYFAYDTTGTKRLSPKAVNALGLSVMHTLRESVFPHILTPTDTMVRRYWLLSELHRMCGFDPTSLDIAKYLDLPLFKICDELVESTFLFEDTAGAPLI